LTISLSFVVIINSQRQAFLILIVLKTKVRVDYFFLKEKLKRLPFLLFVEGEREKKFVFGFVGPKKRKPKFEPFVGPKVEWKPILSPVWSKVERNSV
jgi:hypothetical protein